jgi:hypothetical protein
MTAHAKATPIDRNLLMSSWFALQYFLPQKCARYAISLMVFIFCGFCASLRLTECIPTQGLLSKAVEIRLTYALPLIGIALPVMPPEYSHIPPSYLPTIN